MRVFAMPSPSTTELLGWVLPSSPLVLAMARRETVENASSRNSSSSPGPMAIHRCLSPGILSAESSRGHHSPTIHRMSIIHISVTPYDSATFTWEPKPTCSTSTPISGSSNRGIRTRLISIPSRSLQEVVTPTKSITMEVATATRLPATASFTVTSILTSPRGCGACGEPMMCSRMAPLQGTSPMERSPRAHLSRRSFRSRAR